MDRKEIETAIFQHKVLLLCVKNTASEMLPYEAARFAWKVRRWRVEQAEVILAHQNGIIIGAFVADQWLEATSANFPGRVDAPGRLGFVGGEASPAICRLYVGKRVPDEYRKQGAANPVKYTWSL
jgi:uncharacterized protein